MGLWDFAKIVFAEHQQYWRRRNWEFRVYLTLNVLMLLTIYFAVGVAFADYCAGSCSKTLMYFNYVWGLWLYVAAQANLQLIRTRSCSVFRNTSLFSKKLAKELISRNSHEESSVSERKSHKKKNPKKLPNSDKDDWRYCSKCAMSMPPRSWHCKTCKTCIIRRDHHCAFAMQCVGHSNHCNFLGFLFYIAAGTSYATTLSFMAAVYVNQSSVLAWFLRSTLIFYIILFDFSIKNVLAALNFIGCIFSVGFFIIYVLLAFRGQTYADYHRNVSRRIPGRWLYSFQNLRDFLGPNTFFRVIWPFHPVTTIKDN